ncbi:MAG: cyclopropane-fatty-acyl-phospholipid synthase family protein [Gammaproteobacteria bacterium]
MAISSPKVLAGTPKPSSLDGLGRRLVLDRLRSLSRGRLVISDQGETREFGQSADLAERTVQLTVHDRRFFGDIAFGGSLGAGESYMQGHWSCDDLTGLIQLLLQNRHVIENMEGGLARLTAPLQKAFHWVNRNTRNGSRRNIAAHYDLGNDFFRLWLDPTMMYSSAVFERPDATLHQASVAKLDRICRKLDLKPTDHVVEIGTGWGGFALHAAANYGCEVTTTTISREQFELASQRVAEAGLSHRIHLLLEDYRDLEGRYDKLVSIEMIEAVGHQYLDTYFEQCGRLLKDDGAMLLQAITIQDQRYTKALKTIDFIKRYIFPGSFIPSVSAIGDSVARSTDMKFFHLEDIGPHYATTLRHWRERFFARIEDVRAQGYPEEFIRMWEYYLCYCEGGFLERAIGDVQVLLTKPGCRRDPIVPALASLRE